MIASKTSSNPLFAFVHIWANHKAQFSESKRAATEFAKRFFWQTLQDRAPIGRWRMGAVYRGGPLAGDLPTPNSTAILIPYVAIKTLNGNFAEYP